MDPSHEHIPPTLFSASPFIPATVDGIMTELSFAKSFLSLLDSRPIKLQADHVSPAQQLEITGPYTLPRMPTAMKKPSDESSATAQQAPSTVTVSLKSSRNPVLGLTLPGLDVGVSVLELKERVAKEIGAKGTEKIRVLYQKKPCSDSKTVKEVVGEGGVGEEVEFGVMILGYTASNLRGDGDAAKAEGGAEDGEAPVTQGTTGEEVLGGEDFWSDLKGFLNQRIRDEAVATQVLEKFRGSWKGR